MPLFGFWRFALIVLSAFSVYQGTSGIALWMAPQLAEVASAWNSLSLVFAERRAFSRSVARRGHGRTEYLCCSGG